MMRSATSKQETTFGKSKRVTDLPSGTPAPTAYNPFTGTSYDDLRNHEKCGNLFSKANRNDPKTEVN
jgi:hypothetical protein